MADALIEVNNVFRRTLSDGTIINERILWIDESNIIAYVFNINENIKTGFPVMKRVSEIQDDMRKGLLTKIPDPYNPVIDEERIKPSFKKYRDRSYKIIENIITAEPDIYNVAQRGKLIRYAAEENKTQAKYILKYLRRYWQRGKCKNALLPDFDNCGGLGKDKAEGEKKRGRPKKFALVLGEGKNVTMQDKINFRKALFDYHFKRNGLDLPETYDKLIQEYYGCEIRYDESGIKKTILKGSDEIPTIHQFKYWFYKEYDHEKETRSIKGDTYFELNNRPIMGSSTKEGFGPAWKYQMDSTVGDIYLVSRYNRADIVGRPVIYIIIDVFSRLIVGLHISLEGPSWEQASIAIANAMLDKVSFCKKYGISITHEEWPAKGIMKVLFGDRGELEKTMINPATNALNFRVENAPPYRADWKGIVERYFKTINEKVKPLLPGSVMPDFSKRGGKDYRLDAKLDIYQFTKLIIKCILKYNNYHYMPYYPMSKDLISEDVEPIPIELWRWGIKEYGAPATRDADYIKISLMPRAEASITGHGILFKNKLLYSCDRAIREKWFVRGNPLAPKKVNISYNPSNLDEIYIWETDDTCYDICTLLPHQNAFKDRSIYEVEYYIENKNLKQILRCEREKQEEIDLNAEIDHYVKEASELTDSFHPEARSKSSRVKNIKKNRREEADRMRQENNLLASEQTNKNNQSGTGKVVQIPKKVTIQNDPLEFPTDIDYFMRRQKEKQDGSND